MSINSETCGVNYYQAIAYYLYCNPVRQKSVNLLEVERHHADEDNATRWSFICATVWNVLRPIQRTERGRVWILWRLSPVRPAKDDLARWCNRSMSTVTRWISEVDAEVSNALALNGVIDEHWDGGGVQ